MTSIASLLAAEHGGTRVNVDCQCVLCAAARPILAAFLAEFPEEKEK